MLCYELYEHLIESSSHNKYWKDFHILKLKECDNGKMPKFRHLRSNRSDMQCTWKKINTKWCNSEMPWNKNFQFSSPVS